MGAESASGARSRLLESVPSPDGEVAAEILAACPTVDVAAGEPYFHSSLPAGAALLIVERGFVVLRVAPPRTNRSIITCDAGPGRAVLPPAREEVLFALVDSKLTVISPETLDALLALPVVARTLFEQLAVTLGQKQEAIGTFGSTRHIERVRSKLLQLARNYGRVARDGVRIDFRLSHTLLADMVGSSRETVTRSLDELRRDGFVARQGHTYRLLVARLRRVGNPALAGANRPRSLGMRRTVTEITGSRDRAPYDRAVCDRRWFCGPDRESVRRRDDARLGRGRNPSADGPA